MVNSKNYALILIDIQKGLNDEEYWGGNRNNKDCEKNCQLILEKFREKNIPIFHVIHSSKDKNSKFHASCWGFEIKNEVKPLDTETVVVKSENSAFIKTNLKELLNDNGIDAVFIVGMMTNISVSTTARMASMYGYDTFVVSDATATFDIVDINGKKHSSNIVHMIALASLDIEFADIVDTKKLIGMLEEFK